MKHVVLLVACLFMVVPSPSPAYQLLSPDTLNAWLTSGPPFDFLLIDVRETSEMTAIIATATCRPYHLAWTSQVFDSTVPRLPKTIAIVCYCRTGIRSGRADSTLDAAGFTLTYSLAGGFTAWHGPTDSFSYVKPTSDLPAPSMVKISALCPNAADLPAAQVRLTGKDGFLICNQRLACPHAISLFTADGKLAERMQDPFSRQTRCRPFDGLSRGVYAVRLETPSSAYYFMSGITSVSREVLH